MLAVLVASLTLGRTLWPGAAPPRVVQGTTTAVSPDRTQIGFMPDGHRDPDPRRPCVSAFSPPASVGASAVC